MEMKGRLVRVSSGEVLAEATGTFVPLPAEARSELTKRLGGDFSVWEQWMAENRVADSPSDL